MKVIIAGSREGFSEEKVWVFVDFVALPELGEITEVVSGKARGVDHYGETWAEDRGIPVKPFPAAWDEYGKSAGPIRNQQMADYADALIAFRREKSRGTTDMIERAEKAGLKIIVLDFY